MPLAGFGAMAYVAAIVAAIFAATGSLRARQILARLATAIALFSLWLLYLQAFVIHAFCKYCLASAATSFALAGLALLDRWQRRLSRATAR